MVTLSELPEPSVPKVIASGCAFAIFKHVYDNLSRDKPGHTMGTKYKSSCNDFITAKIISSKGP